MPDITPPAGFTFNQFLILGDEPLMFHTGLRIMFPLSRDNDDFVGKEGVCAPIVRGCLSANGRDPKVKTANQGR